MKPEHIKAAYNRLAAEVG